MSFPPRHPMTIPGMPPMPPGMVPPAYAFSPIAPMMPMGLMSGPILPPGIHSMTGVADMRSMTVNNRGHQIHRRPVTMRRTYEEQKRLNAGNTGSTITVFVGNITDRAPDNLVKLLLQKCGTVVSWKRVQGASGKLQAFGFCEYGDPESALRAIRILHEWEIGDKKLVVKVDAKTKAELDEYKANKKKLRIDLLDGAGGKTPTEAEHDDEEELDEDTKKEDSIVRTGIQVLLRDHEYDLSRPVLPPEHRKRSAKNSDAKVTSEESEENQKDNLDEMDLEEEKKSLIHREIDKFRDTMKKQEEEKEKERERRERDRERRDRGSSRQTSVNSSNRLHSRSTPERIAERNSERPYARSRSRSRDRERERERERSREREREERSRERENANLERVREKEYDREKREKDKEREREEEEEAYERRKLERKLREKEAAYQERLRNWETRERKKNREYEKYRQKEEERKLDETKEAKRLKEFLEDYDDERDDPKYYKGSMLTRRLKEREKELEIDNRDRQREKEELDEIRQKLMEEGHPDPNAELERIKKENEEKFKPVIKVVIGEKPKVDAKAKKIVKQEETAKILSKPVLEDDLSTQNSLSGLSDITTPIDDIKIKPLQNFPGLKFPNEVGETSSASASVSKEEQKPKLMGFSGLKLGSSSPTHHYSSSGTVAASASSGVVGKKKKLTVGEVFNNDEDDTTEGQIRKRKLVPLDYSEDEKKAVGGHSGGSGSSSTQEEKRKHIKNLIDKIPTEKDKLFAYVIDWTIVDNVLMERRIRPWINKKIVEYIGEEEPTLVDFICSKLMAGSTPQSILDDVQMVLDDEAEVFIVKMWRLLIYEIEAKKLGLVK